MTFNWLSKAGIFGLACPLSTLAGIAQQALMVKTQHALRLGDTRVGFEGLIASRGDAVEYWFEYGDSPQLGKRTESRRLPARRLAFYEEKWADRTTAGWYGGITGTDLTTHSQGSESGGYISLRLGTGGDVNHSDGIGMLHLGPYFYCGTKTAPNGDPGVHLGGGSADLRDAVVSFEIRGRDLALNGAELLWWLQTDHEIEKQETPNWRRANWALTGQPLTDVLMNGEWERLQFKLEDRFEAWSYAGGNLSQARPNYAYLPLAESLAAVNCNFLLVLAYVNQGQPPEGVIDVRNFRMEYPNRSLLLEANGAQILGDSAFRNASRRLVDGWRHGEERAWDTSDTKPSEVVFALPRQEMIDTVQLHQHHKWPAKEVQVMVSSDGAKWEAVVQTIMPASSPRGPNFAFRVFRGLHVPARYIKVRVESGYLPGRQGLGELEVFASDARLPSETQEYPITGEAELEPGEEVRWFRAVAKSGTEVLYGEVSPCGLPSNTRPHVETGDPWRIGSSDATVSARVTGFGRLLNYYFEYGTSRAFGHRTATHYAGAQQPPLTVLAHLRDLSPNREYFYRVVAICDTGVVFGVDKSFQTKGLRP